MRLKYLCSSFSTTLAQSAVKSEGQYKVYGASGLVGYLDEYELAAPYLGIVKDGAGVGRIRKYDGCTSLLGTLAYIVPNEKANIDWLKYVIQSLDLGNDIDKTTIPHVYFSEYGNRKVRYVSLDEQQRIATFLDGKCARIDSVIEKTRASIEEYKKLKQSLITRAVTKGIRPARPMKDSGVEWIGDIPADWSTCRLRFLCDILTGNQDTQDNDPNGEYPFYVRSPIVERSNKYTFEGDAILMAGDGAGAGKVFHYVSGKYGCHQRVYSLQNIKGIVRRFLFYYLQNRFYVSIETANSKSTVDSVRLNMLKDFPILMPPLEEQKEIAQYLDEKTAATDLVVGKKNQLVTELERLKKSLIFEYVTGKKAVAI